MRITVSYVCINIHEGYCDIFGVGLLQVLFVSLIIIVLTRGERKNKKQAGWLIRLIVFSHLLLDFYKLQFSYTAELCVSSLISCSYSANEQASKAHESDFGCQSGDLRLACHGGKVRVSLHWVLSSTSHPVHARIISYSMERKLLKASTLIYSINRVKKWDFIQ